VDLGDCLGQLVFLVVGQLGDVFDFVGWHNEYHAMPDLELCGELRVQGSIET
jgi:hypothetical protein